MNNNANKILAGVVAFLTAGLLVMLISSGGCVGGSGGGGGAPAPQTPKEQVEPNPDTQEAQPTEPVSTPTNYDPSAEKQMTLDELEQQVSKSTAEVGNNPRDAAKSSSVPTAQEVYRQKDDRGFDGLEVLVDFDINGNYTDPHAVDASSAEKYPCYKMLYTSSTGVLWAIYVNEGLYIASPLGTAERQLIKEIIVTEADAVTQYDGITNQYSDFPLTSLTDEVGVRVNRVDAQTLDSYTIDALDAM